MVLSTSASAPSGEPGFGARTSLLGLQSAEIHVDRLVAYVNDQEGSNWIGTSYLRSLFKHWVRKDRLLRVDAINAERHGAGMPLAYAPPNATKDLLILSKFRRGSLFPHSWRLRRPGLEAMQNFAIEGVDCC